MALAAASAILALVDRSWLQLAGGLAFLAMGLALFLAYRTGRTSARLSGLELVAVLAPLAAGLALAPLGLRTASSSALVGFSLMSIGAAGVVVAVLISSSRRSLGSGPNLPR